MPTLTGAQAIVEALAREGVRYVFGLAGAEFIDVLDAMYGRSDVRYIPTRHEQGAAFMATGVARASRTPGVCIATAGPGATNLMTGVAAAYKGWVPLIAMTGKQERPLQEKGGLQEIDQVSLFRPITKWSYTLPSASKIPEAMQRAFRTALGSPPGTVHLDLPGDVMRETVEYSPSEPSRYRSTSMPDPSADLVVRAAEMLATAERPVILAGREVIWEDSVAQLVRVAERLGVPVATAVDHVDAFPNSHPLGLGPIARWGGWLAANELVSRADLVLAIGVRFELDLQSLYRGYDIIKRESKLVQVNRDAQYLGIIFDLDLGIAGSIKGFLNSLERRIEEGVVPARPVPTEVGGLKARYYRERESDFARDAHPLPAASIGPRLRRALPSEGVIVTETGNTLRHVRPFLDTFGPDTYYSADGLGCIGSAFPLALGVKLARPQVPVVAVCGDGGFTMNMAELETAVREDIPVVTLVINDSGFGAIRGHQILRSGGRLIGCNFNNPRFEEFARDLGAFGARAETPGELEDALSEALASGKPAVINAIITRDDLPA